MRRADGVDGVLDRRRLDLRQPDDGDERDDEEPEAARAPRGPTAAPRARRGRSGAPAGSSRGGARSGRPRTARRAPATPPPRTPAATEENSGPGRLVVNVGSTRLSVASVATVASAVAEPSALKTAKRWRSVAISSDSPMMPLQQIITAAKTVSRASVAVPSPPATISVTISATSITVTATASTSEPNGSPTRCATTSAWWTAASTAPASSSPARTSTTVPGFEPQVAASITSASTGSAAFHRGSRSIIPGAPRPRRYRPREVVRSMGVTMLRRIAIVGAGPSGFYAADAAAQGGLRGRPDRPAADAVRPRARGRRARPPEDQERHARSTTKTAASPTGSATSAASSSARTSRARSCWSATTAVVYAFGTAADRPARHPRRGPARLAPGHRLRRPGTTATPTTPTTRSTSTSERAVVIGNGNVAVDVARMLVLAPDELAVTDTADHALAAFAGSGVREVVLLGRRGPEQAAFTDAGAARARRALARGRRGRPVRPRAAGDRHARRSSATSSCSSEFAAREPVGHTHRVQPALPALAARDPRRRRRRPRRRRCASSRQPHRGGRPLRAVPTGEEEVIECGLVLRAVGYTGAPVAGVPFDESRGLIRNDERPRPRRRWRAAARRVRRRLDQARAERASSARTRSARPGRSRHIVEDAEAGRLDAPGADPEDDRGVARASACPAS